MVTKMLYNEEINSVSLLISKTTLQSECVQTICSTHSTHNTVLMCLFDNVILFNMLVNRVLDRMFSGHFSLNVHTATIGGHVPLQHHTWPEPQPYANLQSHKGRYTGFCTVITIIMYACCSCFRE